MPASEIMAKFKAGQLHSGHGGPIVKSAKQAVAIKMSYEKKEGMADHLNSMKKKGKLKKSGGPKKPKNYASLIDD